MAQDTRQRLLVRPERFDSEGEREVTFRYRPVRPVAFADLKGDVTHWLEGHSLRPTPDGWLETTLGLTPGVYAYKFQHDDGSWHLDPNNGRTQMRDGVVNNLLCVEGTPEPLLHAPASPWVARTEDGRLYLRVSLRRGYGEGMSLRWNEGSGWSTQAMEAIAEDDSHVCYEALLPVSAREVAYLFVLPDGSLVGAAGGGGQALTLSPQGLTLRTPEWWRDAVLYTIFVDRFRRHQSGGTWPELGSERERAGGDLDGIIEALPHLVDLGVNALHLTPIVAAGSAHRYDAIDPRSVDPALGGEPALKRLFEAAHQAGIRVLLDVTVTHVHRDFFAFADVCERGADSPYWEWFHIYSYPFIEGFDPGYRHYAKGEWHQPLLRTEHPGVVEHLRHTFEYWTRLGADGFRVDAVAGIPLGLVTTLAETVRAINPNAMLFGEVIPANTHRWTRQALDAATDFSSQGPLLDWLCGGESGAKRIGQVSRQRRFARGGPPWRHIAFTATHDQPRLLSLVADARAARLGHLAVLLGPSVPAIYYGDEVGLHSDDPSRNFEDAWPDRLPMSWDEETWDLQTRSLFRDAIKLRRQMPVFSRAEAMPLALKDSLGSRAHDKVVGFRRQDASSLVDVLLNGSSEVQSILLPSGAPSSAEVLLSLGEVEVHEGVVSLHPFSAIVLKRAMSEEASLGWEGILDAHQQLAGHAYAEGWDELATLPTRLYLTATEKCNIGCAHCITDAPARTKQGRARTMQPWVLDALEPALAAASYFGFSHGGESMVAPIFWQALERIAEARRGRPYDVHVLTNGMLLDDKRVRRLLSLGVNSLAISIDGASALTNDRIRLGASLDRVLKNLRRALSLRRELGADLRIGISSVVSRASLQELPALADLAIELGVDWLKIEEMYPCTVLAAHEALRADDPELRQAMADIRPRLQAAGIVLVDHLRDSPGCGLCGDQSSADFRTADDFANRASFRPCRMLWEQACVDPDGTMRPVDYLHAPLGGLNERSVLELWNTEDMRYERRTALRRHPAARRRQCVDATNPDPRTS